MTSVSSTKLAGSGLIVDTCKANVEELIKVRKIDRKRKRNGGTNPNVCWEVRGEVY